MIQFLKHKHCINMKTPRVESSRLSIDDLCAFTGLSRRTVRYYLQIGLIDKPLGEKRGSYYQQKHLSQLSRIKQLSEAGVSLERIRLVLGGEEAPLPQAPPAIGSVTVKSHLFLSPGITVVIDPHEARLSPEGLRQLISALTQAHKAATKDI
jgi:DNA-binding transcriptional MerR regulator